MWMGRGASAASEIGRPEWAEVIWQKKDIACRGLRADDLNMAALPHPSPISPAVQILLAVIEKENDPVRRWTSCVFLSEGLADWFRLLGEGGIAESPACDRGLELCETVVFRLRDRVEGEEMVSPSHADVEEFARILVEASSLMHGFGWGTASEACGAVLPLVDYLLSSPHAEGIIPRLPPDLLEGVAFVLREALSVAEGVPVEAERLFTLCSLSAGCQFDPGRRDRMLLSIVDAHIRHGRMRNALDAAGFDPASGPLWDPGLLQAN